MGAKINRINAGMVYDEQDYNCRWAYGQAVHDGAGVVCGNGYVMMVWRVDKIVDGP